MMNDAIEIEKETLDATKLLEAFGDAWVTVYDGFEIERDAHAGNVWVFRVLYCMFVMYHLFKLVKFQKHF